MANNPELDKLDMESPKTATIELTTEKVEETKLESIRELNGKLTNIVNAFGQMYLRRKELSDELERIEEGFQRAEDDFKSTNAELKEILDELERQYPAGRLDLQNGSITYQPGLKGYQDVQNGLEQE
jgi:chemotaxis protein histidine kinase CheA